MPHGYNNPDQPIFPGELWDRDGSRNPRFENAPFGFGSAFSSAPERAGAYHGVGLGYDSPFVPATFMGSTGSQSRDRAARFDPSTRGGDVSFSLAPTLPTPTELGPSEDSDQSVRSRLAPIVLAGLLRGAGTSRLGVGPVAPPLPDALDWQKQTEQAIMRLWYFSRGAIGSGWDDDCKAEIRRAREICTKAYANGWESDHDVGPYSKPDGSDWTPQDCMRGLISERCGGNPIDKK